MSSLAVEILMIFLLTFANGIFSGSEMAVVSARKVRLEQLAERGDRNARAALKLANNPNDFLSTVQIGITLIGILSGAVGGATLGQRLKPVFDGIPILQPYSQGISVGIVVTIITYLSLVIGELVPKRVALNAPEQIACFIASPMRFLSRLTTPLVNILGVSTDTLLNLLGIKASDEPDLTEEEIKVLIRQGAESGMFEETEHDMVERVFQLGDRPIKAMMTPRLDVVWLDIESPIQDNLQKVINNSYSRFPVGEGSLDNCIGVIRTRDLLTAQLLGEEIDLRRIMKPPFYVPENARTLTVIEEFKRTGIHIALVTEEYGGIEGLVTLNDLMEAIVGDIPSLDHHEEPLMIQREDGSWLLDGGLDINELKDLFDIDSLPDENTNRFHTVGGFMMYCLGHVPQSGEYFEQDGLRFEVVDMDGTRVDKVLVQIIATDGN
ncbi:hemolysin family protein [Geminocystis sp. NIES-3709]|uniref:hemolysin family protein n=1 Tax=Geminocystis sp. NIES-3709 TaxID=1617448 RepID=UPI0005FC4C45|nr:hemolysin family protein [Geminocystis sp. NIES-3709]BAQ66193.1 magnesium and cobalt efflux protein CorC [Geminocystis sp. NIES-3709]